MGGVEKNEVPQQGGGGADINWNSPLTFQNKISISINMFFVRN